MLITRDPTSDKELFEWYEKNKKDIQDANKKHQEYFGLSFSKATLCGAILQIASMGINLFSMNQKIPASCKAIVSPKQKAVKFCVGRSIRDLPIGIIIYAARNQYSHWDDPNTHRITKKVFDALSLQHGSMRDPAFDLKNPTLEIYSHNVVSLLEWESYESYLKDIKTII